MSRSYHQHHKIQRHEKCPSPYCDNAGTKAKKRRKMLPYGSIRNCGYGGEIYIKKWNEEVLLDIINKRKIRRKAKEQILKELNDEI